MVAEVLLAAMTTATNAFVLAQRNGAGTDEVSARMPLSTMLPSLTFPFNAWLLSSVMVRR